MSTMSREPHVNDHVRLPSPSSDVIGRVIRVQGQGPEALVLVEYPLDEDSSETLTKGFYARQLQAVQASRA